MTKLLPSDSIISGTGAQASFTANSVLDTDAGAITGLVNKMSGQSYGQNLTTGFNPAGPQNV